MPKYPHLFSVILSAMGLTVLFMMVLPAQRTPLASTQAMIDVNALEDEDNSDYDCSLREVVQAANDKTPVDSFPKGDGEYPHYLPIIQNKMCKAPSQPLLNGDFEQGTLGWIFDPYGLSDVVNSAAGISPHSGNWMAYLEPPIHLIYPSIEQSLTVPECLPYLVFWWSANTSCGPLSGDRCGSYFKITVNDANFASISGPVEQPWKKEVVDLRVYKGMTILLRFISTNAYDSAHIAIDDISFQGKP